MESTLGAGFKLLQDLPLPLLWGTQDIGRMAARGWGRAGPGSEVSQRSRNWGSWTGSQGPGRLPSQCVSGCGRATLWWGQWTWAWRLWAWCRGGHRWLESQLGAVHTHVWARALWGPQRSACGSGPLRISLSVELHPFVGSCKKSTYTMPFAGFSWIWADPRETSNHTTLRHGPPPTGFHCLSPCFSPAPLPSLPFLSPPPSSTPSLLNNKKSLLSIQGEF